MHAEQEPPWLRGVRGEQVLPLITEDPPSMRVAAGPGTGKTFGLRRRVLRLLHPEGLGLAPDRVLVCAFNRVIADEMRAEIADELAAHGLDLPDIRTVHALAAELEGESPRFLLPHEIETMVYDIRHAHPEIDARHGNRQAGAMRALRDHEAGLATHPALATAVREWLADHGAGLVGDLPRRVETRLRGGDFSDTRYDHIIVDEFQDLTKTEAQLALGLRAPDGHVVGLGDRKQSIYAFRGNVDRGLDAFPDYVGGSVTDHPMDECQRCPSEIVVLANEAMAIYGEPLRDVRGPGGQLHQIHHLTPEREHPRMAEEIVRVFRERPSQKHLVLVTRRKWGYDLRHAIREVDPEINAQTVFSEDILETWPAREAFIFLSILGDPDDPVTLRDWVSYKQPNAAGGNWKAPNRNAAAYRLLRAERGVLSRDAAVELAPLTEQELRGAGKRNVLRRVQRLRDLLTDVPETTDPAVLIAHVLDHDRWVIPEAPSAPLALDDIDRLRREAERMLEEENDLTLEALVRRLRYRIATREPLGEEEDPDVKIVTLWGAKGLTADFVYIVGLCDEALPGPYDQKATGLSEAEHDREQLRLLYVSLTRAKQAMVLSRALKIRRGEVPALGLTRRNAGDQYRQDLRQCRFFSAFSPSVLPASVDGRDWDGIQLGELSS